jgi:hypothetical protein
VVDCGTDPCTIQLHALLEYLDERGEREHALLKNLRKYQSRIEEAIDERERLMLESLMAEPVRRSSRVRDKAKELDSRTFITYFNRYEC